jgi:hypothetical protein
MIKKYIALLNIFILFTIACGLPIAKEMDLGFTPVYVSGTCNLPHVNTDPLQVYWNWDILTGTGTAIAEGQTITWSGVPGAGWSQYKDKMLHVSGTAANTWSFLCSHYSPLNSQGVLKIVAGQFNNNMTLEHETSMGAGIEEIWVYNNEASFRFYVDATL